MEAASFGIPSIATSVGGIPELVNSSTGILLGENPSARDVYEALRAAYELPTKEKLKLRNNAFDAWQNKFKANKNAGEFVRNICLLCE